MILTHKCADSAFPAGVLPVPKGFKAVQFYIGERQPIRTPTPHIWTSADIAKIPKGVRRYPVFVGTPAIGFKGHPETEAFECLEALYQIGAPKGTVVGLDFETAVDPGYVSTFHKVVHWGGYRVWVYGSLSTVTSNPPCDGYDVAHYTNEPHFTGVAHERACQYADSKQLGTNYDARVVKSYQWFKHLTWR